MATTPIALEAQARTQPGTRAARRLRREGRIPAVVYGHGVPNASITLPKKSTLESLNKGAHLFDLRLDGTSESVLVKDVQYDHLGIEVLHIDLHRVNLDEEIHSEVALHFVGTAKGVATGGIVTHLRDTIEVVCRVRDLPDEIRVDVSGLDVGDSIHAGELQLPEGVRLPAHEADFTIAMVAAAKASDEDEVANANGDEPEIIGGKKTADQDSEGEPAQNA